MAQVFAVARREAGSTTVLMLWTACIVALAVFHLQQTVNHDVAWIFNGIPTLLDGGAFGVAIDDVNPPFAWWVHMPVVLFAQATGVSIPLAFKSAVFGLGALTLLLTRQIAGMDARSIAILATILLLVAGYDFGQREHIMVLAGMPYIVLASQRAQGRSVDWTMALVVGLLAAVGFSMKPHFWAVPAAVEVWLLWHTRSLWRAFRVESLVLAAGVATYALATVLLAPAYLTIGLPTAWSSYDAFNNPLGFVVAHGMRTVLWPLAAIATVMMIGQRPDHRSQALLAAAAGAFLAYAVQSKGWQYHLLPTLAFAAMAAAHMAYRAWVEGRGSSLRVGVAALMLLVPVAAPTVRHIMDVMSGDGTAAHVANVERAITETGVARPRVMAFTTGPRIVQSAVLGQTARWGGTSCCFYLLPASLTADASERAISVARGQMDSVMDRLEAAPPHLLLVDVGVTKVAMGELAFDYFEWFAETYPTRFPDFIEGYAFAGRAGPLAIYRLR